MYGKIFDSIYDGTLRANWKALITFQQLIILADPDGIVDMTPHAIHGRTGIPLDIIEEGLEHLSKPDPYSRSSIEDGRRLVPLDDHRPWGWRLVNHHYYNQLRSAFDKRQADRERAAEKRKAIKTATSEKIAECRNASQEIAEIAPITKAISIAVNKPLCASDDALLHHFAEFWKAYPKKKNKGDAEKAWKKLKPSTTLVNLLLKNIQTAKTSDDWKKENGQFIPYPASWLNAKGWEDEYPDQKKPSSMFEGAM